MSGCILCPRACNIDRRFYPGVCGAYEKPRVARAMLHMWEEPCISGTRGSGTIFFSGCNLSCVFCQNFDISAQLKGEEVDESRLASIMLALFEAGAHNINLVTPAPHVVTLVKALRLARDKGLTIPVVYNTNAYERVSALCMLDGLVDVYLPDLKYASPLIAKKYSGAEDYFEHASSALAEMWRQCGPLKLDENGLALRGVLVRHLVLPGSVDETRRVLDHLSENYPKELSISLMCQYVPMHKAASMPPLDRRLMKREYERALEYCLALGYKNVFTQELSSATSIYTPAFDGEIKNLCE